MHNLLTRIVLTSTLISMLLSRQVVSQSQPARSSLPNAAKSTLTVQLDSLKSEYVLGVPVQLRVTAVNPSNSPIRARLFLDPQYGDITLFISRNGIEFIPYLGPDWETIEIEGATTLDSGGKRAAIFSVLWNNNRFRKTDFESGFLAFPEPGTYVLKARLGTIESNSIKIDVVAPSDADEAIWEQIKADSRLTRFIQDPRPDERDADILAERLEVLAKTHADSKYAVEFNKTLDEYRHLKEAMERMRPRPVQQSPQ